MNRRTFLASVAGSAAAATALTKSAPAPLPEGDLDRALREMASVAAAAVAEAAGDSRGLLIGRSAVVTEWTAMFHLTADELRNPVEAAAFHDAVRTLAYHARAEAPDRFDPTPPRAAGQRRCSARWGKAVVHAWQDGLWIFLSWRRG